MRSAQRVTRKPATVQRIAITAAMSDSPATKPDAMGMLNVSALRGLNFAQANAIKAPIEKERLF